MNPKLTFKQKLTIIWWKIRRLKILNFFDIRIDRDTRRAMLILVLSLSGIIFININTLSLDHIKMISQVIMVLSFVMIIK